MSSPFEGLPLFIFVSIGKKIWVREYFLYHHIPRSENIFPMV